MVWWRAGPYISSQPCALTTEIKSSTAAIGKVWLQPPRIIARQKTLIAHIALSVWWKIDWFIEYKRRHLKSHIASNLKREKVFATTIMYSKIFMTKDPWSRIFTTKMHIFRFWQILSVMFKNGSFIHLIRGSCYLVRLDDLYQPCKDGVKSTCDWFPWVAENQKKRWNSNVIIVYWEYSRHGRQLDEGGAAMKTLELAHLSLFSFQFLGFDFFLSDSYCFHFFFQFLREVTQKKITFLVVFYY